MGPRAAEDRERGEGAAEERERGEGAADRGAAVEGVRMGCMMGRLRRSRRSSVFFRADR